MSNPIVRIAREELYQQVWETPMRALAEKYGLSDVGLANICERFQIPRPSVGYWAKREFGKAPPQPPLPNLADPGLATVELVPSATQPPENPTWFDERLQTLADSERVRPPIIVSETLRRPHRFVVATKTHHMALIEYLRLQRKQGSIGLTYPDRKDVLSMEVSEAQFSRALRILDALVKGFDTREFEVRVINEEYEHRSEVTVDGDAFEFGMRERRRRVPHVLTEEERNTLKRYPGASWFPKHDLVPTGVLELSMKTKHGYSPTAWIDKQRYKLEDVLNEIPLWLLRQVDEGRRREAARREAIRREDELRRERAAAEERRRQEQARVDALIQDARDWEASRVVRAYVGAVREQCELAQPAGVLSEQQRSWLAWAESIADRMDPLMKRGRPSS